MLRQKISILLALVGIISSVSSNHEMLRSQRVFPDDENWLASIAKRKLKDSGEETNDSKNYKVCNTPECKRIADEFLTSINKSVDPCNDFYDFACSGWSVNNPIPPSLPAWSRFAMFQETVHHRIKVILETDPKPSDILPVRQAKKWYHSCMDTESREERGVKPIESILIRTGGWPICMDKEEWDSEAYTWQDIEDNYARLTGSYVFIKVAVFPPKITDNAYGGIIIFTPDLPLSEHLPLKYRNYDGNDYDEYVDLVSKIAVLFMERNRADVSKDEVKKEAREIVEFEKKIYEIGKNSKGHEMTFEEFVDWYENNATESEENLEENIDWPSMIQKLFDTVNIKVHPSTEMYVTNLSYMRKLSKLMSETPPRTIVNYIHWNFVSSMLSYTTKAVSTDLFEFVSGEYGIKEKPPLWSECIDDMKMTHAAAYAFVNKYYKDNTESKVFDMIKNIQKEMDIEIGNAKWLDDESRKIAKDKLESMKVFVGYPDWYKDKTAVLKSYKGLSIGNEYFDNALSYQRFNNRKELKIYSQDDDADELWPIDPITVNAVYGPDYNALNIPAVDYQPPLFTPQLPDNVNYGIVGVIIGHEIGHGFDDTGIKYGKDGNETTLSEKILKSYYQRAECFTDQFDGYYGETEAPGTTESTSSRKKFMSKSLLTRGENIADSTGLQTVFKAYRNLKKSESSTRLPGMEEFTDDQLFFFSFAAMWCSIERPEYAEKKEESFDEHSPAKLRVIGAVSNTKDFAEAFKCPEGSPMNPVNKCSIWESSDGSAQKEPAKLRRKHNRWERQWKG